MAPRTAARDVFFAFSLVAAAMIPVALIRLRRIEGRTAAVAAH
jgi:hypothetical protein